MLSGLSPLAVAARRGVVVPDWVTRASTGVPAKTDADFSNNRYWFKDAAYYNEAAWLEVISGTKSGITRTIGPFVDPTGTNLLSNGTFDSATTGWSAANSASIASVAGELEITTPGSVNFGGAYQGLSNLTSRAFRYQMTGRRGTNANDFYLTDGNNTNLNSGTQLASTGFTTTSNVTRTGYVSVTASPNYFGVRASANAAGTAYFDNASLVEAWPFLGWTHGSFSFAITATTPASIAADEVLWQAGADTGSSSSESDRVRVVRQVSDSHIVVIVTSNGGAQASMDLGAVGDSTQFSVSASIATNAFSASLNGGVPVTDTVGIAPGCAKLWIGRSYTGDTWGGTIERVTVF